MKQSEVCTRAKKPIRPQLIPIFVARIDGRGGGGFTGYPIIIKSGLPNNSQGRGNVRIKCMTQEHNNNTRTYVQLWTLYHCKSPDILCRLFRRKPAESVACYSKLGTPIWELKKKFMFLWGFKAQPNNKRSPALLTNQWESGELYIMPVLWFISHVGVHHKSFITDGWCSLRQYCLWTRNSEVIR